MVILIIGHDNDAVSLSIQQRLEQHGADVKLVDLSWFPTQLQLSYRPTKPLSGFIHLPGDEAPINLQSITSVFYCRAKAFEPVAEPDAVKRRAVMGNLESTWGSLCRAHQETCLWVNPVETGYMHPYKPFLIQQLVDDGIRMPDTLITNHPEEVVAFYEAQNKQVIYKPVYGWGYTEKLTEADLVPERLAALAYLPYCFQELIAGVDCRVYVVGDQLFPIEIQTDTLDFRVEEHPKLFPFTLPEAVSADCLKMVRSLGLMYAGIDMRRTPEGEYVFFEANPSPVFIRDEQESGHPIGEALCQLLLGGVAVARSS